MSTVLANNVLISTISCSCAAFLSRTFMSSVLTSAVLASLCTHTFVLTRHRTHFLSGSVLVIVFAFFVCVCAHSPLYSRMSLSTISTREYRGVHSPVGAPTCDHERSPRGGRRREMRQLRVCVLFPSPRRQVRKGCPCFAPRATSGESLSFALLSVADWLKEPSRRLLAKT